MSANADRALAHYSSERAKIEIANGNIAWFAPLGIPMIAMTPERTKAIVHAMRVLEVASYHEIDINSATTIRAMLAEARGAK